MPLGLEVGLDPDHIVLDGVPAPPKGAQPQFLNYVCCGQRLDESGYHLVQRYASAKATLCFMRTQFPHGKGHSSPLLFCPLCSARTVAHLRNTAELLLFRLFTIPADCRRLYSQFRRVGGVNEA